MRIHHRTARLRLRWPSLSVLGAATGIGLTVFAGGTITVVNTAWNAKFATGIPASTPVIRRCQAPA